MIDRTWMAARLDGVPASLRALMAGVVERDAPPVLSVGHLQIAAEGLLQQTIGDDGAADPACLLAADALITLACEALSEFDPRGLADIR